MRLFDTMVESAAILTAVAASLGASVVRQDRSKLVRHFLFGDQIAPPNFQAIDAEIDRCKVEQALDEKTTFVTAWSPEGARRRLVAEQRVPAQIDIGDGVGAGHELRRVTHRRHAIGP